MRIPSLPALVVGTACLVAPLAAQEHENPYLRQVDDAGEARRGPYYASAGVGLGGEAIADLGAPAGPYTASRIRPTLNLALGANVGQQLRVGLEGFAWFNVTRDGALETVTAAMVGARVYPLRASGLYLRAAGGFGRYGQESMDDYCGCSATITSDFGLAWTVGGGFEAPVARGLWLGPSIEMVRMNFTGPSGYRERVINFGLTLTFDGHD
ncbi:MAG: hypothetical protein ABI742_10270 [Gemmatimonadota bacterium]